MRFLLLPFAFLFALITGLRNKLFDWSIFKSYTSTLKTICIGNIQVGGTGKTPHTAMFYDWFHETFNIGILSRGYGRKTEGLIFADEKATPQSIGDEPLWYYQNLKKATILVSEDRKNGLKALEKMDIDLVLLDDAFQHRAVKCQCNIVLTDFQLPYYNDYLMPVGRLREWKSGAKKAEIIVLTKCPSTFNIEQKKNISQQFKLNNHQSLFFTTISYQKPLNIKGFAEFEIKNFKKIIAICGIAKPKPFLDYLKTFGLPITEYILPDHTNFSEKFISKINSLIDNETIVFTTEKDAVKLNSVDIYSLLPNDTYFSIPISTKVLFDEEVNLKQAIEKLILI